MKFIQLDEIKNQKLQHIVDDTSSDDYKVIEELEAMSISEISAYLGNVYDVNYIFSRQGTARHDLIRRITTEFIIYYLFIRISGENIPAYIYDKHQQNIDFLTKLATNKISVRDLPKLDITLENRKTTFKGSSESQFVDDNKN